MVGKRYALGYSAADKDVFPFFPDKEADSVATSKKRAPRLGRGLSSLMSTPVAVEPPQAPAAEVSAVVDAAPVPPPVVDVPRETVSDAPSGSGLRYLAVDSIVANRHQPRQDFAEGPLRSLAASIQADGLMQPVVVRPLPEGESGAGQGDRFELVAGERRWRAAQMAGLDQLPAIVRELDDQQIAEWALIENLQREDLNPMDRAEAFHGLVERFGLNHNGIAKRLGIERSTVSNLLRLLSLSDSVQALVRDGLLSMGQARAIAGLTDRTQQEHLASKAIKENWSVRQVEAAVRRLGSSAVGGSTKAPEKGGRRAVYEDIERDVARQLGTKVRLKPGKKKGTGSISLEFYSLDHFQELMDRFGVKLEQ